MPYQFRYANGESNFACEMKCTQCEHNIVTEKDATGKVTSTKRCKLTACIGTPYCHVHLLSVSHLRIKASTLGKDAGKGLFAMGNKAQRATPDKAIFKLEDHIVYYGGEAISKKTTDKRYPGDSTGPYAVQAKTGDKKPNDTRIEDAACMRGAGSLANNVPSNDKRLNAELYYNTFTKRIGLLALRDIKHGEEIFVNYGDEYRFDGSHSTHPSRRKRA